MTPELINSLHLNAQARSFMLQTLPKGMAKPERKASSVQAANKDKVLDIFLYGQVGLSWYEDGVGAADIAAVLASGGEYDRIHLRINSPGGSVFEGSAIYSLLQSSGKPVDVRVDGMAASAAFTIAMVGDTISVNEAAMMMLHNSWGLCIGDADDMEAEAGLLRQINGVMASVYSKRSGLPLADVGLLMKAETWLSAKDAVAKGFATKVADGKDDGSAKQLASAFNLHRFAREVPKELEADEDDCTCDCPACVADDCASCSHDGCTCAGCECDQGTNAKLDYSLHERRLRAAALRF